MPSDSPNPDAADGDPTLGERGDEVDARGATGDDAGRGSREPETLLPTQVASGSAGPTIGLPGGRGGDEETMGHEAGGRFGPASAADIPGYEILGELGRGGMGVVYQARQVGLNRTVALKMILAGAHAGTAALARFRAEAEAVAQLQHPNLVHIYEIGECGGLPFFSLEYVDGGSLDRRIEGNPWKPRDAARLVEPLARAIHEAHRKGVVHRDLKPANVLLTADGTPKITDFGLAKRLDRDTGQTRTGALLGTPSYMAPEQAEGKSREIGPPADIYALGAILYELLTGRPPFRAATPLETVKLVTMAEPVPPARLQPGLPRDLETICLKCLQKEPHRRYADAELLARDLAHFLADEPIEARRTGPLVRAVKWAKRRPAIAALFLALCGVTLLGAVGVTSQYRRAVRQRDRAQRQYERAERFLTKANRATETANREARRAEVASRAVSAEKARADAQLYDTSIALAYREWLAGDAGRTRAILSDAAPRFRGWEWAYLDGLVHSDALTLRGLDWWVSHVRFADDDRQLVALSGIMRRDTGTIGKWDAARGALLTRIPAGGAPVALSEDGRLAAMGNGERVLVWNVAEGTGPVTLRSGTGAKFDSELIPALVGAFRSDGKRLAIGGTDNIIHVWDLERNEWVLGITGLPDRAMCVAYRPDGHRIVSTSSSAVAAAIAGDTRFEHESEIHVWDADSGKLILHWSVPHPGVYSLAYSPDGTRIASAGVDGAVRIWDAENGRQLAVLRGNSACVVAVAFSPDGGRIAASSWDRMVRLWSIADEREIGTFRGHALAALDVAFSRDGRRLVTGSMDLTAKVWDVGPQAATGAGVPAAGEADGAGESSQDSHLSQEFRALAGHHTALQAMAFTSDGRLLISGDFTGFVRVWDVATGRTTRRFRAHDGPISAVDLSRDGTRLVTARGGLMGRGPGEVKLWDLAGSRELRTLHAGPGPVSAVQFSPDGARIASAVGGLYWRPPGQIRVWDAATGAQVAAVDNIASVLKLAFRPDGRQIASVGFMPGIHFWDASTGARAREPLDRGVGYCTVAYDRDGSLLAAGSLDGPIGVWDAASDRELARFPGHTQATFAVTFSPDGRLVSAGGDGAVRIYDVAERLELLTLRHHNYVVFNAAFDPTGRVLATCGGDSTIKLYEARQRRLPGAEDWTVVFADTFDRPEIGAGWETKAGQWSIERGALRGVLAAVPDDVNRATITLRDVRVPQTADIRYDLWSPKPMVGELKLVDEANLQGLLAILIGHADPNLNGGKRGAFLMSRDRAYNGLASRPTPELEASRTYHVRVLREPSRLTMFVDGAEVLSSDVSPRDLPELQLQGSWAPVGSAVYFDNVKIRVPGEQAAQTPEPANGPRRGQVHDPDR